jgi:hypothetical protein
VEKIIENTDNPNFLKYRYLCSTWLRKSLYYCFELILWTYIFYLFYQCGRSYLYYINYISCLVSFGCVHSVANASKMKWVMRADPQIRISDRDVQIVSTLNGSWYLLLLLQNMDIFAQLIPQFPYRIRKVRQNRTTKWFTAAILRGIFKQVQHFHIF